MANHKIPVKDKELVKLRLAQGASTRDAIRGTVIRSNKTAALIARDCSHEITQIREEYLDLIKEFGADDFARAKQWAQMARATTIYGDKEVPDWGTRVKALKYIDALAGLIPEKRSAVNIPDNKPIPILSDPLYVPGDNGNQ